MTGRMGIVVEKVAVRQVFSYYFGFLCQFSFRRLLYNHHLPPGVGELGQLVTDMPSELIVTLTPPKKLKESSFSNKSVMVNTNNETKKSIILSESN
jgi:hypothetical protein